MSVFLRHSSPKKKVFNSSLSIKLKPEKRSYSVRSHSDICLNKNFYKKNSKVYNENLLILNYMFNCSKKKYSAKTALSDSAFKNLDYDLSMVNKYDENLNSSLSFISNFDLENSNNENNNSFDSENDDDSLDKIEIKNKYKKIIKKKEDENEINDELNKEFLDIKKMVLGVNEK